LKDNGLDTEKDFPPIRVFGTIGFICTMWFVNCAVIDGGSFGFTLGENASKFQYTYMQFMVSGLLSIVLCLYCFTLPECKLVKKESQSLAEQLGLSAFKLFKTKKMAMFFIFSMLLGVCLQITNGYASPFIQSFAADANYAGCYFVEHANLLISLSQMSETFCILLIPFFMKRYGIKTIMLIAMLAWVCRFGFFAVGNPSMSGVGLLIISMIVYGVAFDFFNISGSLFVDRETAHDIRSSAQGLFMLMTNGLGAGLGMIAAQLVVNSYTANEGNYQVGEWPTVWFIFAAYALAVSVMFALLFKDSKESK
jgi:nucleoside transporter